MAKPLICPDCGYRGKTKKFVKGSIFIEIILWLFFLIPGLIYSIWRLTSTYEACPKCGLGNMVPLNSLRGKKLSKYYYPENKEASDGQHYSFLKKH